MDSKITALEQVFNCIREEQNFVLQGGAGSGKTESLKRVIEHISKNYPGKKIACITHTNLAVDEIKSRVDDDYTICTIHSFLNDLIKDYKKNLHEVIGEIFKLKKVDNGEHKDYKKCYEKYASTLHSVLKETVPKVVGKREYDKEPDRFYNELNANIEKLNSEIEVLIKEIDFNEVRYNETRFDSFRDLSFGHDSLLVMASLLFDNYSLLTKILQDKYDFIFVDEYQDTNKAIVDIFLNKIPSDSKTIIGLFGDSMQGIYDDGIGDVEEYIANGLLKKVEKEDNYRCSEQVIEFINQLRDDGLKQEVAFKTKNGEVETKIDRQGAVKLYYSIYDGSRTASGNPQNKEEYLQHLNSVIKHVDDNNYGYKKLMLTNKSIASEVGFENLYNVFNDRYVDVKEEIEKDLTRLQLLDLAELSKAYSTKDYNFIITELKKAGFLITTIEDKKKISSILDKIVASEHGAIELLELAFENRLLKKSDSYSSYIDRKDSFLTDIKDDEFYPTFKTYYEGGQNTFTKMAKEVDGLNEEVFKEFQRLYKKERFYNDLFSSKIKFKEILNYFSYLNEETNYITMHKTKGSGIENVMVVLDEYFWYQKYKFKTIFDESEIDTTKRLYNQKLFYVACSRAIDNLICIRLIAPDEKDDLLGYFSNYEEIKI
ncbi:DNA helicase-2 / ATP-dependent DNA helicase PcrA [Draconibacterium orientale]|uniref:DNA 3'-5' helicase II n=1 Tax=Draconibacterium orientale TaxID=1168034 RepID=X5DZG5_9BACT|nr:UvrD-helicase domain-containing protein [Draconibacterium orientale]AHW60635.1 DNA helicase [Draconibacterium orientale]SET06791.1 DNA helicase-2 / ATP-dependent DNA helicase PcrA [Draconibacterium orientale]